MLPCLMHLASARSPYVRVIAPDVGGGFGARIEFTTQERGLVHWTGDAIDPPAPKAAAKPR